MILLRNFLVAFFVFFGSAIHSQSLTPVVMGTAGDYFESTACSLTWTLGENFILNLENEANILTQGFHQTNYLVISSNENLIADYQIHIFPNPVLDQLQITAHLKEHETVHVQVFNLSGQLLKQWGNTTLPLQVSGDQLAAGTYFLKIVSSKNQQVFKTFKIIKL